MAEHTITYKITTTIMRYIFRHIKNHRRPPKTRPPSHRRGTYIIRNHDTTDQRAKTRPTPTPRNGKDVFDRSCTFKRCLPNRRFCPAARIHIRHTQHPAPTCAGSRQRSSAVQNLPAGQHHKKEKDRTSFDQTIDIFSHIHSKRFTEDYHDNCQQQSAMYHVNNAWFSFIYVRLYQPMKNRRLNTGRFTRTSSSSPRPHQTIRIARQASLP